jgi:hypothetical protein
MKKVLGIAMLVIGLMGCATTSPRQTYLPDGRQGYVIECAGVHSSWGDCYQQAGEVCGLQGYEVLAQTGDQGHQSGASPYGAYSQTLITRSLVIACKS